MSYHRAFLVIAGLSSLSLVTSGPMLEPAARVRHPMHYREPRTVMHDGPNMTKREKREMMQRDFAIGGSRHGRKRRQRLHRCRHKE